MIETGKCGLCRETSKRAVGPLKSPLILCPKCDARPISQINRKAA